MFSHLTSCLSDELTGFRSTCYHSCDIIWCWNLTTVNKNANSDLCCPGDFPFWFLLFLIHLHSSSCLWSQMQTRCSRSVLIASVSFSRSPLFCLMDRFWSHGGDIFSLMFHNSVSETEKNLTIVSLCLHSGSRLKNFTSNRKNCFLFCPSNFFLKPCSVLYVSFVE